MAIKELTTKELICIAIKNNRSPYSIKSKAQLTIRADVYNLEAKGYISSDGKGNYKLIEYPKLFSKSYTLPYVKKEGKN